MRRIMLVDDEPNVLSALRRSLVRSLPHDQVKLDLCLDPLQALRSARRHHFDVVMADYHMPAMNGITFLTRWRAIQPGSVRIVLTASTDFSAIQAAINKVDVFRYFVKPWSDEEVLKALSDAFAQHDQMRLGTERHAGPLNAMGQLSPEDVEKQRLESLEPGITRVRWDTDGSVLLDDDV